MLKVALAHDQLTVYRGAERVLDVFHSMYPTAPIYTTIYLKNRLPIEYEQYDIKTSFINLLPYIKNNHKIRAMLYPFGITQFKLSNNDFNLLLSDTQGIAKGIRADSNIFHISYIHTPPWSVWGLNDKNYRRFLQYFGQKWDYQTAQHPDILIANSKTTQNRIRKLYNRDAEIIYPPVEIEKLRLHSKDIHEKEDYILFIGGLEGYKGEIELARACTEMKQKVIIIGKGKNEAVLSKFSKYVILENNVSDIQKAQYIKRAKALFNGSNEDFGINMAETIALGTPVIALGVGGALEIVEENKTGIFINNLNNLSIKNSIKLINNFSYDSSYLQTQANKYDKNIFIKKIKSLISQNI